MCVRPHYSSLHEFRLPTLSAGAYAEIPRPAPCDSPDLRRHGRGDGSDDSGEPLFDDAIIAGTSWDTIDPPIDGEALQRFNEHRTQLQQTQSHS